MTTASPPEVSAALFALVETCRDGELGFHAAAASIEDPLLRQLCESYADQRAGFRRELGWELARLGLEPVATDPVAPATDAATWSAAPDESATLAELARRDAAAEATYREALDRGIPGPMTETVERQHLQVRDALKHLGQLERALAAPDLSAARAYRSPIFATVAGTAVSPARPARGWATTRSAWPDARLGR